MTFPTDLSAVTDNVDDVMAGHVNNVETKIGVDNSAVTTSQDFKIRKNLQANYVLNGNFINNSSDGYGGTPDDWVSSSANQVQGGIPTLTKAQLISILGVGDGDIEGLWPLNEASGNALDLSSNSYDLTDTNSVLSSDDGLMAKARNFELDNSEYFTIADASCANLEIAGSQTWFAWVRLESDSTNIAVMAKRDAVPNATNRLFINSSNEPSFTLNGLTGSDIAASTTALKKEKWYFLCGVYDSVNELIKIWVNGVKTEITASGSATDTDGDFSIGREGAHADEYMDGLVQNAGILSVALTDDQVKRLWVYTSYKGQKIRRDGTDALLYQNLPQDVVERLRGKTVTLRAKVYAESTNHRIYIYDGTTTTPVSPTSADAWEEISATVAIGADATFIRIALEADTTDGNMWIKEVALYEGSTLLPYNHSEEDWARFPRLLRVDPPAVSTAYQFEENRWFVAPTPTYGAGDSMTYTSVSASYNSFMINGNTAVYKLRAMGTTGGSASGTITVTLPALAADEQGQICGAAAYDGGWISALVAGLTTSSIRVYKYDGSNWALAASKYIALQIVYEID